MCSFRRLAAGAASLLLAGGALGQTRFAMDAASPSNFPPGAGPEPHTVEKPGLTVTWSAPTGVEVDAISPLNEDWLSDPCQSITVTNPATGMTRNIATLFWWSVDRPAGGPGTATLPCPSTGGPTCITYGHPVEFQAALGEAAGDIFLHSFDPDDPCIRVRSLWDDEATLGEVGAPPGPPIDEMSALSITGDPILFSVTAATAGLLGVSGATLLIDLPAGPAPFLAPAAMGLTAADDIDALSAGPGGILFSLAPGSPSLAMVGAGPGDVFANVFPNLYAPAAWFDLAPGENLDGLHVLIGDPFIVPSGVPCGTPLPGIPYEVVEVPHSSPPPPWWNPGVLLASGAFQPLLPPCSDDQTLLVPLSFPFAYGGAVHNNVTVSANGWLAMGIAPPLPLGGAQNLQPGAPSFPQNLLAPFWDDLYFPGPLTPQPGQLARAVLGEPGSRQEVFLWTNVGVKVPTLPSLLNCFGSPFTGSGSYHFGVILREGSNEVEFLYLSSIPSVLPPTATCAFSTGNGSLDLTGLGAANQQLPQVDIELVPLSLTGSGVPLGTGCPDPSGITPFLTLPSGPPVQGNLQFEVAIVGAPPNAFGFFVLGFSAMNPPLPVTACANLYVQPTIIQVKPTGGIGPGSGSATFPVPIPVFGPVGDFCAYAQGVGLPSTGIANLSVTNAVELRVQ